MRHRSPSEFYIKYLLLHPDDYTDQDIFDILDEQELDPLSVRYINKLRRGLRVPDPFRPLSRQHVPSQRLLLQERVDHMFHPTREMRQALSVLESPRAKEEMEMLGMVEATEADISERMKLCGLNVGAAAVGLYAHYFWNVRLATHSDLYVYLHARLARAQLEYGASEKDLLVGLEKGHWTDPRLNLAKQPTVELRRTQLQIQLGYMPNFHEMQKMLTAVGGKATMNTMAALQEGTSRAATAAREYATVAKLMHEMLRDTSSGADEMAQQVNSLTMETSGETLPLVESLPSLERPQHAPQLPERSNTNPSRASE